MYAESCGSVTVEGWQVFWLCGLGCTDENLGWVEQLLLDVGTDVVWGIEDGVAAEDTCRVAAALLVGRTGLTAPVLSMVGLTLIKTPLVE